MSTASKRQGSENAKGGQDDEDLQKKQGNLGEEVSTQKTGQDGGSKRRDWGKEGHGEQSKDMGRDKENEGSDVEDSGDEKVKKDEGSSKDKKLSSKEGSTSRKQKKTPLEPIFGKVTYMEFGTNMYWCKGVTENYHLQNFTWNVINADTKEDIHWTGQMFLEVNTKKDTVSLMGVVVCAARHYFEIKAKPGALNRRNKRKLGVLMVTLHDGELISLSLDPSKYDKSSITRFPEDKYAIDFKSVFEVKQSSSDTKSGSIIDYFEMHIEAEERNLFNRTQVAYLKKTGFAVALKLAQKIKVILPRTDGGSSTNDKGSKGDGVQRKEGGGDPGAGCSELKRNTGGEGASTDGEKSKGEGSKGEGSQSKRERTRSGGLGQEKKTQTEQGRDNNEIPKDKETKDEDGSKGEGSQAKKEKVATANARSGQKDKKGEEANKGKDESKENREAKASKGEGSQVNKKTEKARGSQSGQSRKKDEAGKQEGSQVTKKKQTTAGNSSSQSKKEKTEVAKEKKKSTAKRKPDEKEEKKKTEAKDVEEEAEQEEEEKEGEEEEEIPKKKTKPSKELALIKKKAKLPTTAKERSELKNQRNALVADVTSQKRVLGTTFVLDIDNLILTEPLGHPKSTLISPLDRIHIDNIKILLLERPECFANPFVLVVVDNINILLFGAA